jgi:hypothetical protein
MSMTFTNRASAATARLERIYLAALRIIVLLFATICILAAGYFAVDGLRRSLTSTHVEPEPVAVSTEEALKPLMQGDQPAKTEGSTPANGPSAAAKTAHETFLNGTFVPYYEAYRAMAAAYNKPEDTILSKADLADRLGYTAAAIDSYEVGDSPVEQGLAKTARLFQTDSAYAGPQINVITDALKDPRLLRKAMQYKAAQKTAQACSTAYVVRSVWDPNSTACVGWYEEPYGCSVRRQVPVEQCVPAYPEGIRSPLETIIRLDAAYRLSWADKINSADEAAAAKSTERQAVKAKAPGMLLLALQVFGVFLAVMFMFLLVAVERHLRRLSRAGAALAESDDTPPSTAAA